MKRHWRNISHDEESLPDSDSDTRSTRKFPLTRLMAFSLFFSLFLFSLTFLFPHPPIESSPTIKALLQLKQTQQGFFLFFSSSLVYDFGLYFYFNLIDFRSCSIMCVVLVLCNVSAVLDLFLMNHSL